MDLMLINHEQCGMEVLFHGAGESRPMNFHDKNPKIIKMGPVSGGGLTINNHEQGGATITFQKMDQETRMSFSVHGNGMDILFHQGAVVRPPMIEMVGGNENRPSDKKLHWPGGDKPLNLYGKSVPGDGMDIKCYGSMGTKPKMFFHTPGDGIKLHGQNPMKIYLN